MSEDLTRLEQIFTDALVIPDATGRDAYLDEACNADASLRQRVEALLEAHTDAASFLPLVDPLGAAHERPGTLIDRYKLLEQIGEGGFGVVFMAEQEQPVRRRVALKVIKAGMDTKEVIARFEAERQALAMMDHPNIAKVFDAGTSEAGRPYFAMELVQGIPITEYCDECNLTMLERLDLFVTVCQAVQHAHQKGVIHRDIKPNNVLVAMKDGRATPKIIDFGIAKAIGCQLAERTLTNAFAQMIGTPLYMSPEQAELSPLGVDTRSDIYSLGVLLYELLTGTTPFDKDRFKQVPCDELRRIIRDEEPPRPSTRISTMAADLATTVMEHRRTDRRRLTHAVRGELDWIVMKALDKDRSRRYESAGSLARDVERYLSDEPVHACPPSTSYRIQKFVRRHKSAAALLLILIASVVALTVSNLQVLRSERRANTESAKAVATSELLLTMLSSADMAQTKGPTYTVRELLDEFAAALGDQLSEQPDVEGSVRATIARAYRSLQLHDEAQPHFERAIELIRQTDGEGSEQLAAILADYSWNLNGQHRLLDAEAPLKEAVNIYRQRGISGEPYLHALRILQDVLLDTNRRSEAARIADEAIELSSHKGEEYPALATILRRHSELMLVQGDLVVAEQLARRALDMHRRLNGVQHMETAVALNALAAALQAQKRFAEAEVAIRESLAIFRRLVPADHYTVRQATELLRSALESQGDSTALAALSNELVQEDLSSEGPQYYAHLAKLLVSDKSLRTSPEAHQLVRRAIEAYCQVAVDFPNDLERQLAALKGIVGLVQVLPVTPEYAEEIEDADCRLVTEIPRLVADFPESNKCLAETAMLCVNWATELMRRGVFLSEAENAITASIELQEKLVHSVPQYPNVWPYSANTHCLIGEINWLQGDMADADAAFRQAMRIYGEHLPEPSVLTCQDYLHFAYFLASTRKDHEARKLIRKAELDANHLKEPSDRVTALYAAAIMQVRLGDNAGYEATCKAMAELPVGEADDETRARWIMALCLGPHDQVDFTMLVDRAEKFTESNSLNLPHFGLGLLGATLYRASQYGRAVEALEDSIAGYPTDIIPTGFDTINLQRVFLLMARWQLGHHEEARRLMAESVSTLNTELQASTTPWYRRALLEVLFREAKELLRRSDIQAASEDKR